MLKSFSVIDLKTFHKAFYFFVRILITPYFYFFGNYKWKMFTPKSKNYLLLTNHNTNWDFFLAGLSFKKQMYFVASEHILRLGFISKVIKFLVDPIPRKKGASGAEAVKLITERLQAGSNVCMMVEGNRSFSGETGWISPANAPLVRNSGAGLITYRIHGGYFVNPRWSKEKRKGAMYGEVVREYTPEEIAKMTDEEITEAIRNDIYVNAYDDQKAKPQKYTCENPAESLETALFVCPECHEFSTMQSKGDMFFCKSCDLHLRFNEYGYFEGSGAEPFKTVLDWDKWQQEFLKEMLAEVQDNTSELFSDAELILSEIKNGHETLKRKEGKLSLFSNRLQFENLSFSLNDISKLAITLRDTMLFTTSSGYFEIKSQKPYSALKYLLAWRYLTGRAYR